MDEKYESLKNDLAKCVEVDEYISLKLSQLPRDRQLSKMESYEKKMLLSMKEENLMKMHSLQEVLYFYEM